MTPRLACTRTGRLPDDPADVFPRQEACCLEARRTQEIIWTLDDWSHCDGRCVGLHCISIGAFTMSHAWIKSLAYRFVAVALFVGVPTLGRAQSMQQRLDHLNHCTDLIKQSMALEDDGQSVEEMIDYKKGTLTFGS